MEKIQNIYKLASAINQREFAERIGNLVQVIKSQNFTNVAVTGLRNIGKTTFINEIIGREVWEPGTLDENEKPLRISFEPVQEDEKFNCLLVSSPPWHDLKAIIYELREDFLISENALVEDMYPLDFVFFIISATSPLQSEEINFLKALAPLKRQVVVNNIQQVKEDDRQNVLNYISKICDSLELPPAIIFDSGKNFAKLVRNLVPAYIEVQELRERKCNFIFNQSLNYLEKIVRDELETLEKNTRETTNALSLQNDQLKSGCYTLRMDVEDLKKAAVESVTGKLSSRREIFINEIFNEANQSKDKDKIQIAAEEKYISTSNAAIATLQKIFLEDLSKIDSSAKLLAIPHWSPQTFDYLTTFSPQNILENFSLKELTVPSTNAQTLNPTLLVGTGIVTGGLVLAPLPTIVTVGGAVAALGYGLLSYLNDKKRKNQEVLNILDDTCRQAIDNIKDFIRKIAAISYGKISEQILLSEDALSKSLLGKSESKLAQMHAILQALEDMKEKNSTTDSQV